MGLGHTLMEELVLDRGRVINTNLGDYKLPTIADIPKLQTVLLRSGGGLGPYEAKSIGELVNNSAAAAVANAVADAVGVRLFELPITSERIYDALKNAGNNHDERNQS
jgi:CO/xanthine dehydrogenase Mo-binding subunit